MTAVFCSLEIGRNLAFVASDGGSRQGTAQLHKEVNMRVLIIASFSLALLGACSMFDSGGSWMKPGENNPDQARTDLDNCEAEARAQTKVDRGIDQDIAATQGGGAFGDPLADSGMSGYQSGKRYDDIVDECMQAFGYARQ
jgi:hypothetical protein